MTYATRAILESLYGQDEVSLRESVLPSGALDRILEDADAEIDSYLSGRYAVPLSPAPTNISRMAASIARYRLLGEAATELARKDYEDTRSSLRDYQAGRAHLNVAAASSGGEPANTVVCVNRPRVFNGGLR